MTPRQALVLALGLGLIIFRLWTDENQRQPLMALLGQPYNPGNALGTNRDPGGLALPGGLGGYGKDPAGKAIPYDPKLGPAQAQPHAPGLGPVTHSQPAPVTGAEPKGNYVPGFYGTLVPGYK